MQRVSVIRPPPPTRKAKPRGPDTRAQKTTRACDPAPPPPCLLPRAMHRQFASQGSRPAASRQRECRGRFHASRMDPLTIILIRFFPSLSFRSAPCMIVVKKARHIVVWCCVLGFTNRSASHFDRGVVCWVYREMPHGYPSTTRHKCPSYIVEQAVSKQIAIVPIFLYIWLAKRRANCTFHQVLFITFHKSSHEQFFFT
jgi:hypothetical protein